MLVENPAVLAIESSVSQTYERLGQRALGFFVIHLGGKSYGVRSPEATLLACSFDAVKRRISRRGMHRLEFGVELEAAKVADAVRAAVYDEDRQNESFSGMSADAPRDALALHEIVWAPDGDAAFDDGGHLLHFDQGNTVRLIAFKNTNHQADVAGTWLRLG